MVQPMSRRGTWARGIALIWATLQLVSPGVSAIADGTLALESASAPLVHVEATGSASCPEVHSPDCGVCRYLSTGGQVATASGLALRAGRDQSALVFRVAAVPSATAALPHGRAPPVA